MYLIYTLHKEYNNTMYMTVYGKHKRDYNMSIKIK